MEFQSAIWFDYKHHSTVEFLICVVPNSAITLSKSAPGGAVTKQLS